MGHFAVRFSPLLPGPGASKDERRRLELAHLTPEEREEVYRTYGHLFEERWFALPNAMYGNWQSSRLGYRNLGVQDQVKTELRLIQTD